MIAKMALKIKKTHKNLALLFSVVLQSINTLGGMD
jgi:hypothetical protein